MLEFAPNTYMLEYQNGAYLCNGTKRIEAPLDLDTLEEAVRQCPKLQQVLLDDATFDDQCFLVLAMISGLDMLADAFIDLTDTPLPGGKASDVMNAQEQVYQTPLFRQFIERIQNGLKAALSATPEQYPALREEYHQYTILPEEYAAKLLGF